MTELNWPSRTTLRTHLADLGADIEFWEGAYPPEPPTGERLSKARAIWDATDADWSRLRDVSEKFSTPWASELLISFGDAKGMAKASDSYRLALEASPRPNVDAEIGCLLMRRSGLKEMPFSERELEEMEPEICAALFDILESPLGSPRTELILLALQAYGRAYGYYDYWWGCENYLEDIDCWRQLLILDGLRTSFIGLQDARGAELCCDVFDLWVEDLGIKFTDFGADAAKLAKRFGDTSGAVKRGEFKQWKKRDEVVRSLKTDLDWLQFSPPVVDYVMSASFQMAELLPNDDHAPAVIQFAKAAECAIRRTFGGYADSESRDGFAVELRVAIDRARRRGSTSRFSRVSLTNFAKALSEIQARSTTRAPLEDWVQSRAPEADRAWTNLLVRNIQQLANASDRARHADEQSWKISREEAERITDLCIGPCGILRQLGRLQPRRRRE